MCILKIYSKKRLSFQYLSPILDELTPDDVRCLLLAEDELARSAPLERILPAPNSHRYIGFTEHPRYYNRLLDAWEHRYCHNRADGITLLQSLCAQKVHLQVPPSTLKKVRSKPPLSPTTFSCSSSCAPKSTSHCTISIASRTRQTTTATSTAQTTTPNNTSTATTQESSKSKIHISSVH